MARWGRFVIEGDPAVLSDSLQQLVGTQHTTTGYFGEHNGYGYGQFTWDLYPLEDGFYPLRVVEHGGNTLSFTSVLLLLPDHDVVLSILSAGYGDDWTETTEAVLRAVVDPLPAISDYTGEPFEPDQIDVHVGSYSDDFNFGPIEVMSGGAYGLRVSMPRLEAYGYSVAPDLIPASTDLWYVDLGVGVLDMMFIRDDTGGPSPYVRNRIFVGTRTPDATTTTTSSLRPGPTPPLDRARLDAALAEALAPSPVRLPAPLR